MTCNFICIHIFIHIVSYGTLGISELWVKHVVVAVVVGVFVAVGKSALRDKELSRNSGRLIGPRHPCHPCILGDMIYHMY